MQNITFRRCQTRNNYECGFAFALYACTVLEAPASVTLEDCHSIGDRMGSYNVESISANVSGSILLNDCTSTGGSGPGLMLRGKDAKGASLQVTNMRLINTATKMWVAGGEQLRFPVSIVTNGKKIGAQGGVHFTNLTVIDQLETIPGGSLKPGPLEGTSKRAWLNATDPKGLAGISGDVTVVNSHGCSEIVTVGPGAPKDVALQVTCKQEEQEQGFNGGRSPPKRQASKWTQEVFGISDWVTPRVGTWMQNADWIDRRMKEFADANFTVMLGGMDDGATWNSSTLLQLQAAEKYGIKIIPGVPVTGAINRTSGVSDIKLQSDLDPKIIASPAFWGFDFYDEPNSNVFPALANLSRQVGAAFPAKVRFINLLPNYADPSTQLMAKNYTDYVRKFVTSMVAGRAGPDILCMDHYPFFEYPAGSNHTSSVAGYRANLGVLRAQSLRAGIPFWNFFNDVGWLRHSDPTEAQMRWQVFTSLAYGAKGVLYYCYNSEPCGRGGVLHDKGQPSDNLHNNLRKGRHYSDATRINSVLKIFGKYLVTATSTAVYRVQPAGSQDTGYTNTCALGEPDCPTGEQPSSDLSSCVLFNITAVAVSTIKAGNGLLIGQFQLFDGRTAVLLQNQNWDMTLWPAFQTKAPIKLSAVLEVDPSSGTESLLQNDEPGVVGARADAISLDLAAGAARLLIMPPHAGPLSHVDRSALKTSGSAQ